MNPVGGSDFYVQVFNSMLAGAPVSSGISAVTEIATGILVASFLLSVYGAFVNGANLAAFGRSLAKFIIVGVILTQWTAFFNELVSSSSTLATNIFSVGAGATDIYQSYSTNLSTYLQSDRGVASSIVGAMTLGAAQAVQVLALFLALCIYYLGMLGFAFWYSIWGLLLYMLGPLFIAAYPSGASAPYAKSYIKALVQWCLWPILYHILGSLIASSNMLTITPTGTISPSLTWSAIEGSGATVAASIVAPFFTAAVTIVFALLLLGLPFIADHLVNLNFGAIAESAMSAVRIAAGIAVGGAAGAAGAAGGAAGGAGGASGAGAGSGSSGAAAPIGGSLSPPPASSSGASASGVQAGPQGVSVAPPPSSRGSGGSVTVGGFVGGALRAAGRAALGREGSFVAGGQRAPRRPLQRAASKNDE